jgi:RNA polymerase sigma-70 factor, ECF subfamily
LPTPEKTPARDPRIAFLGGCNNFGSAIVLKQDGDGGEVGEEEARTVERVSKDAFEKLAREQLPRLYSVARQLTDAGAEDLVQECLLRAYRAFGTLSAPEAGSAWMRAILVNAYRDRLRKESRAVQEVNVEDVDDFSLYRTIAEEDPFPYSDSLHLDILQAFGKEDVHAVLMRLPDIYRAPLVLRYMQGFATKEIARMLGAPLGTVLARLHRGRKVFEKELWLYASETGLLAKEVTP